MEGNRMEGNRELLPPTLQEGIEELLHPGETDLSGPTLLRFGLIVLPVVIIATNLVGACAVLVIANFVVPLPTPSDVAHVRLVDAIVAAVYVTVAVGLGVVLGRRALFRLRRWLAEDRPATEAETLLVLR